VRAIQYDLADPEYPASLVEVDEPALPRGDWARIQVTGCGICGSDLHLFSDNMGGAPALGASMRSHAFPFVLGHELAGVVIEAGPDCRVATGTRVAVLPDINCEARGIDPPCPPCANGWPSACHNVGSGVLTPGSALGFTSGLGGGWAEQAVAHESMLFPLPDAVGDDAATLHEPVSIAVHGLLRAPLTDGDPVLVIGAAAIGLATVAAVKALCPASAVTVVARHDAQADAAVAVGADRVVRSSDDRAHFEELAADIDARLTGFGDSAMLTGGYPYVVDAVGYATTVTDALRLVDTRGTVLLLGAAATGEYDLSPLWWKECAVVGAVRHSTDPGLGGGPVRSSVARAVEILASGVLPANAVVTHEFALEDHREAIRTALDREGGALKVVFRPGR
jgi:threonine dehydrogenase-like Zn-dependent dehydrogenase